MTATVARNDEKGRPVRRTAPRLATLAVLGITGATAGGLLDARPASAHAQLLGSDPRADSTVTRQLDEITLTFTELVRGNFSTVVVSGPDGLRHGAGQPRAVDKRVHLPVEPVRSGSYRVAYRVVSADGHPIEGQFRFTVTLPRGQEPTPAPGQTSPPPGVAEATSPVAAATEDTGSGTGRWWAGAAALGTALVTTGSLLVRRQRRIRGR